MRISRRGATAFAVCVLLAFGQSVSPRGPFASESEPPLVDGEPLRAHQFPRFVRPTQGGEFGFDQFVVAGDHVALPFERIDLDQESGVVVETWERIDTSVVAGRVVSVFRPVWSPHLLRERLRQVRWGVDRPFVHWGDLVVPGDDGGRRRAVYLRLAPTDVPAAEVVVVSDTVQYSSHLVNLWIPDFGDGRLQHGSEEWDLSAVTQRFYEYFADGYETIAIVTQAMHPTDAFHRNVQNAVAGIGLPLFDDTAQYGSAGVLQGVEMYPSGRWADAPTVLHQQAHQWSDYSQAWARAGIARQGDLPERHTPLLAPGPVLAGAVLEASRRVGGPDNVGAHVVERTTPMVTYNPLTLYRMGLASTTDLPTYRVFEDQGQFGAGLDDGPATPAVGSTVAGGHVILTADDFVAADGIRNGPIVSQIRRAVVYVTRAGLASQDEMDVVSYFAARLGTSDGVTTWDAYPSLFEATGGRVEMPTGITPALTSGLAPLMAVEDVGYPDVPTDVLTGVELDLPIPGRIDIGQTVTLDGVLTLIDRTDYNIVCFRFIRYGGSDVNETFVCDTLDGVRFSVPVTFGATQAGTYTVEPFVFWTDAGPQAALSRYGVIVVE